MLKYKNFLKYSYIFYLLKILYTLAKNYKFEKGFENYFEIFFKFC